MLQASEQAQCPYFRETRREEWYFAIAVLVSCLSSSTSTEERTFRCFLRYLSVQFQKRNSSRVSMWSIRKTKKHNTKAGKMGSCLFTTVPESPSLARFTDGCGVGLGYLLACGPRRSGGLTIHMLRRLLKASDTRIRQQYSPISITCRP